MKQETAMLLDKARRAIGAARALLERGDTDFAIGRAYYAMFYAAEALPPPRAHSSRRHENAMKEVLNARIKRREPFRPFAPSILEENVGEYFTESYAEPFMIKVYPQPHSPNPRVAKRRPNSAPGRRPGDRAPQTESRRVAAPESPPTTQPVKQPRRDRIRNFRLPLNSKFEIRNSKSNTPDEDAPNRAGECDVDEEGGVRLFRSAGVPPAVSPASSRRS